MSSKKIILVGVIACLIAAFFAFDLDRYLSLDYLQLQRTAVSDYYQANPAKTALVFFGVYVVVTGLSLPGAAVMTLVAGAVFGLVWGTVVVSFASTIGATLAFLVSRYLLREPVQRRLGARLKTIDDGMRREGGFYLFGLRLVPAFPFFLINLAMGLTPIRTRTFFLVSQAGMLPGTIVYVNAGTQLAAVDSLGSILSPALVVSFTLLGLFPIAAKKLTNALGARRPAGAVAGGESAGN